jgi:LPS-assembly lipoprotein
MTRILITALLALALSACGFHLRNAVVLPPDLGPVRIVSGDPYSPLAESLAEALERIGAAPVRNASDDVTGVVSEEKTATLQLLSERWGDTPISIDQFGRAQEFSLRYAVVFALVKADGTLLLPQQTVELSRDYIAPPADSIGKTSERELLVRELRREMSASILRRIGAAVRTPAAQ